MSNQAVGNIYQIIIEEVINSSRVDFEENGVDEGVLGELKLGWQEKLTQLNVATFPWDPKPEAVSAAPAPAATAPTVPPAVHYSQAQLSPQVPPAGLSLPTPASGGAQVKPEPGIKQEPGLQNGQTAVPQYPHAAAGVQGWQRAQQNLQQQYGQRATNSISAIQAATPGLAAHSTTVGQPLNPQQYRQGVIQQQRAQAAQNAQPGARNGQADGAGDVGDEFEGVLMERNKAGILKEMGRVEIDRMLHDQIMANAKAMEGGGLMVPLKEATRHSATTASSRKPRARGASGFDGNLDGEESDEDAINSDLDDPDDQGEDDDDEEEGLQHVMLCMYDKVQRVKNKWKCVLKDGVLTVNGKEYVFHKATGEYEW